MLIIFLPLVVALIAALVGVFGKSWDDEKNGWRRLTWKGWTVIILAFASFGVASFQAYDAYQTKLADAQKTRLIRTIASNDIDEGLNDLLKPFKLLLEERGGGQFGDPINRHMVQAADDIEYFKDESFMKILDQAKAMDCPKGFERTGCSWAQGFSSASSRADEILRGAMIRYSSALPPITLTLMDSVVSHKMMSILKSMLGNVEVNQETGHPDIANVTVGWLIKGPYKFSEYYLPFLTAIQNLKTDLGQRPLVPDQTWIPKPAAEVSSQTPQPDPAWTRVK